MYGSNLSTNKLFFLCPLQRGVVSFGWSINIVGWIRWCSTSFSNSAWIINPDEEIVLPSDGRVDHEAELGIVISRKTKDVTEKEAKNACKQEKLAAKEAKMAEKKAKEDAKQEDYMFAGFRLLLNSALKIEKEANKSARKRVKAKKASKHPENIEENIAIEL